MLQRGRLSSRRRTSPGRCPSAPSTGFNGAASHRGGGLAGQVVEKGRVVGLQRGRLSSRRRTHGVRIVALVLPLASTGPPLIEAEDNHHRGTLGPGTACFNGAASHRGGGRPTGFPPDSSASGFNGAASHRGGGRLAGIAERYRGATERFSRGVRAWAPGVDRAARPGGGRAGNALKCQRTRSRER